MKTLPFLFLTGYLILPANLLSQGWILENNDQPIFRANLNPGLGGDCPQNVKRFTKNESDWNQDYSSECRYDNTGHLSTEVRFFQTDNHQTRDTYEYNAAGMNTCVTHETAQPFQNFVLSERTTYVYDWELKVTSEIHEIFNSGSGQWEVNDQTDYEYEYDNDRIINRKTVKRYNTETRQTEPTQRYTYQYQNSLVSSETQENYKDGAWKNVFRNDYTYLDDAPKVSETVQKRWVNDNWAHFIRIEHAYEAYNSQIQTYYMWMNDLYNLKSRITSRNDSRGNPILYLVETWEDLMWIMYSGYKYLITYQGDHATERIQQNYTPGGELKTGGEEWIDFAKWEYSEFLNVGVDWSAVPGLTLACFPNPASGSVEITYTTPLAGDVELILMTLDGKVTRLSKEPGLQGKVTWDLNKLPAGIYVIRLRDQAGTAITQKIIKE